MNKEQMRKLMHQAKLVGCDLFLGDDIQFITYYSTGKVNKKYHYDYADPKLIENIRHHIDKIAFPLRREWGGQFLELASIAFSVECTIIVRDYSAILYKGSEYEGTVLLECPFNSNGLHTMSDFLTNALLGDELNVYAEEENNIMGIEEKIETIELTPKLARIIAVMYFRMTPEEEQALLDSHDKILVQTVKDALKISSNPEKSTN